MRRTKRTARPYTKSGRDRPDRAKVPLNRADLYPSVDELRRRYIR
jgi:hypothetical protein